MSGVSRGSGARVGVLLASALFACTGRNTNDLFAPATSSGTCATNCGSSTTAAGGTSTSSTTAAGTGAGGAGGGASTTGGGASTTGGGASTTGGSASTTGGSAGSGGASSGGTAGTGSGGSPVDDGGVTPTEDAQVIDAVVVLDTGRPDQGGDALVGRDACVTTGMEICDGIDNNCNGNVDEGNSCRNGCVGATHADVGYMLCYGQTQQRDWNDADTDCKNRNMHLVRVEDAQQNAFIRKTSLAVGYSEEIWIGANDLQREGEWVWTDGTQFWQGGVNGHTVGGHFEAWDMNQPNSAEGPEDCAAVWTNIETWHDISCGIRHAYMCQAPAPLPPLR